MSDRQTRQSYEKLCDVLYREWDLPAAIRADYMAYVPFVAAMLFQRATLPDLDHAKWDADMLGEFKRAEEELGIDPPFDLERAERVINVLKTMHVADAL